MNDKQRSTLKSLIPTNQKTNTFALLNWWWRLSKYNKKYITETFSFDVGKVELRDIAFFVSSIKNM